jgi:hypothetical protein
VAILSSTLKGDNVIIGFVLNLITIPFFVKKKEEEEEDEEELQAVSSYSSYLICCFESPNRAQLQSPPRG